MNQVQLIRPGILVGLKSTVSGGVAYQRIELEHKEGGEGAPGVDKWETTKIVDDPEEHERAVKVRSKALSRIRKVAAQTSFGLLVPEADEAALWAAYEQSQADCRAFNASSNYTKVYLYMLAGRVASTDEEAARAIGSEVAALVREMEQGIDNLDPERIRDAANRARELGAMLDADAQIKVTEAIEQARKAARAIVARIEKKGEDAAIVARDIQRGAIEKARIAFLDFDTPAPAPAPAGAEMPVADVARVAELDLESLNGAHSGSTPAAAPVEPAAPAEGSA
jgi:hypothetical protein